MKTKLILSLILLCLCLSLTGCGSEHDTIDIYNRSGWVFDNIIIETKAGYFYDRHEKFTVDDNTIGVTVYFSMTEEDTWNNKPAQQN